MTTEVKIEKSLTKTRGIRIDSSRYIDRNRVTYTITTLYNG